MVRNPADSHGIGHRYTAENNVQLAIQLTNLMHGNVVPTVRLWHGSLQLQMVIVDISNNIFNFATAANSKIDDSKFAKLHRKGV